MKFGSDYHVSRNTIKNTIEELIDAVSSAKFLTVEESNELIEKIKTLTSKHLSRKLNNQNKKITKSV